MEDASISALQVVETMPAVDATVAQSLLSDIGITAPATINPLRTVNPKALRIAESLLADMPPIRREPSTTIRRIEAPSSPQPLVPFIDNAQLINQIQMNIENLLEKKATPRALLLPDLNSQPYVEHITVEDEWNAEEFATIFAERNRILIRAAIPGAGKTHSLLNFCKRLPHGTALFVTPYNALADDLMRCLCATRCEGACESAIPAITFHRLTGMRLGGEDEEEEEDAEDGKQRGYDVSNITHIVFDEIYCHEIGNLGVLQRWMERHAVMGDGVERKFFAAGDPNQNAPISTPPLCLSRQELKDYYDTAIATLFPRQITLRVCKRVKTPAEREKLEAIKDAVLYTNRPLLDIAREYFKVQTSLENVKGMAVCYLNETARVVNTFRHERVLNELPVGTQVARPGDGRSYYVDQLLRCRKYLRFGRHGRLHVNNTYRVMALSAIGATVQDTTGDSRDLSWAQLRDHFVYALAHTCHSLQGMSAADGITIFDIDFWYVTREWFYTALTRATSLEDVYYWWGDGAG